MRVSNSRREEGRRQERKLLDSFSLERRVDPRRDVSVHAAEQRPKHKHGRRERPTQTRREEPKQRKHERDGHHCRQLGTGADHG